MMNLLEQISAGIERIRTRKPLIHHITNYISLNDCANVTLAIGASPIMANDPAEVVDVVSQASVLVLNLGTPNTRMLESLLLAGRKANELGIPVIFDPVGAGFTQIRTRTAEQLLHSIRLTAVRGNLAEIQRMAGDSTAMRGIDSLADEKNAAAAVRRAAAQFGCMVAATGVTDYISDGHTVCQVRNGTPLLSRVTGTGCMTTSLVAACCAANGPSLISVVAGVMFMGVAGEIAQEALRPGEGTGSFRVRLLDAVSNLTERDVWEKGRCTVD